MASIVSGMQIQISGLMLRGALLAVLALTACGTGEAPGAEDAALESSEAALACQVTQQCSNGTTVSCGSASGVCTSGTESGGWVECDGARKYCPVACTCGNTRLVETGRGTSFNCAAAYGLAQDDAYWRMEGRCPAGTCNVTEAQAGCSAAGSVGQTARYTVTFSCNEPVNCQ